MDLEALLAARLAPALHALAGVPVDPAVRPSQRGADFQSGAALALARTLRRAPRDLASAIAEATDLSGIATVTVSGPGFLNLTLDDALITSALDAPIAKTNPERIVLDYSGPNVAKQMHVGHLRSTIIGDALARIFEWQGHDVVRVNHLGDWGTPVGMLIEHGGAYQEARQRFDADPDFRDRARRRVVALQSGDPESRARWTDLVRQSEEALLDVYARLDVTLGPDHFVGESFYQDALDDVVAELEAKGLLAESEGALCAFPEGYDVPLIVRKGDGGYAYGATDLAAIRHRVVTLEATKLLYVVGAPQRDHFRMVFAVAREAGWLTEATAEHIGFGPVLGSDGKMLKSRSGDAAKLADLLDEAVGSASAPEIGIGALKYADLSSDRRTDYVFDVDRMLARTGNTGPYLQYAHARIRSLLALAGSPVGPVRLVAPEERKLALAVLGFEPTVTAAAAQRDPHRLAGYLYDLAATFSSFYEQCPVLKAEPALKASRLRLSELTARTLRTGLSLLGIAAPEEMRRLSSHFNV
ncbi:arginine--tRNA ligase [Cryptosporangium sp. NPDC048952]|uniref:arginine--tRNA ligase n=1 Tax=Cryptosporangium sp. NPDC048952 TaxID=3363961 RepID=UPI00371B847B